jgi:hypothetical protein
MMTIDVELTKVCTTCEAKKSVGDYYKEKAGKYGVRADCKCCANKQRKAYKQANKQSIAEKDKAYYQANKEAVAAHRVFYRKANPHIGNAISAKRRASKMQATPAWADLEAIKGMYQLATIFNRTGMNLQVDHIVPLQSDLVCGLHCEANLQLLPASDNISKGNRHWPDMPV